MKNLLVCALLTLFTADLSVIAAQNIKVTASSSDNAEFIPEKTVDDDINTRWSSKFKDNQWIIIDLGVEKEIAGLKIVWETASGKEYRILGSNDKIKWELLKEQKDGKGGIEILSFPPVKASYVKLELVKRATEWGFSIWECAFLTKQDIEKIPAGYLKAGRMPSTATVLEEPKQTINGWGCEPVFELHEDQYSNFLSFEKVRETVYKDLGVTIIRLNIQWIFYDSARNDGSLNTKPIDWLINRFILDARKYGITQYFYTIPSPPEPFKTYYTWVAYGGPDKTPNRLMESKEDNFVKYIVDFLKYVESKGGGLPVGLAIQNELTSKCEGPAAVYNREQYQRVAKKLRKALDKNMLNKVLIIGPESADIDDNWLILGGIDLPDLKNDKELNKAIGGIAHHTYDQYDFGTKDPALMKRYNDAAVKTGKDLWMTEWSGPMGRDWFEKVINGSRHLIRDLVLIQNNYYSWFLGWQYNDKIDQNYYALTYSKNNNPKITKMGRVLQKLFHSAPPGCVVKHLTTDDPDLKTNDSYYIDMVAFESKDSMVVMLVNHTAKDKEMEVKGLKGKGVSVYQTTQTADMALKDIKAVKSGTTNVSLPAYSVTILVTSATYTTVPRRDAAYWPFSAQSPWNMSIGSEAIYENIVSEGFKVTSGANINCENWSMPVYVAKPTDPLKKILMPNSTPSNPTLVTKIPDGALPDRQADASFFVIEENHRYVYEPCRSILDADGNYRCDDLVTNDLQGDNLFDTWHGSRGYGGSGIAGLIRKGELKNGIRHSLAVGVRREALNKNTLNGKAYVWPASAADGGWETTYGNTGNMRMGSLLAIPPSVDIKTIGVGTSGPAYEVAKALQDYGAYIEDCINANMAFYVEPAAASELGNLREKMGIIIRHLQVITNNSPESVNGGGTPRRESAPLFTNLQ
ncbi:MAG: discoidin domain-containing protein [Elusimicrobiota bacterium]